MTFGLRVAKWVLVWALMTPLAHALPGPEVLAPVGAGLLQIVALLVGTFNPRKVWRKRHRIWRKIRVLTKALLAILVVVLLGRYMVSVPYWKGEQRPTRLPHLPQDLATAEKAIPMPNARLEALRKGGKIVVYLGEPADYMSSQLPVRGYLLRPADWNTRQHELQTHSA